MKGGTLADKEAPKAPRIIRVTWGRVEVAGYARAFKDAKLFPGGAREWDWNETGTHHIPGVQPGDVEELLAYGARVVVLTQGFERQLQVSSLTISSLEDQGITVHVLPTEQAVELYNRLRVAEPVGALIHSTC